jgi:3-oxoacyl-[acyl-carrier protein] reductase
MFSDKVVLVTGASRGIGRAIALSYALQGANVCVNYATNSVAADEVVQEIKKSGRKAFSYQCDVSSEEEVKAMVKTVETNFGNIDILINNAGITKDALILRMGEADWQRVMDVNLRGVFLCTKYAAKSMMKKRYGHIINVSSVVAYSGNIGQSNYIASKSGVVGFTKVAALEFASWGIRVNAVVPGFIDTEMTENLPEDIKKDLTKKIALGYIGKAEDIAGVVTFLTSKASDYITGQSIHINGGLFMY